jgi:beta-phosphoglucomutase-like phosphatase (HAD superfamily)
MNLPRKAHAVIFDMDGLIFDTEPLYRDAIMAAADDGGHDMPLTFCLSTIGLSGEAIRALYNERFGEGFDFDGFWITASKRFYEMAASQLRLKVGVVELLDLLDDLRLPRAIATSSHHEDVRHHLDAHGLVDRFQAVVAQGDYARGKPNPDPYLKAAERLGVEPARCLALEDSTLHRQDPQLLHDLSPAGVILYNSNFHHERPYAESRAKNAILGNVTSGFGGSPACR